MYPITRVSASKHIIIIIIILYGTEVLHTELLWMMYRRLLTNNALPDSIRVVVYSGFQLFEHLINEIWKKYSIMHISLYLQFTK